MLPLLLHFKIYKIYKLYFWIIYGEITINIIYINNILGILSNILEMLLTKWGFGGKILSNRKEDSL